jgi:amino acid adenylation domain-containing protein
MLDRSKPTIADHLAYQPLDLSGRRVCPTNPFGPFNEDEIEQSIPARFEQQVHRYPDRLAIKTRSQQLTYIELNRLANRIACAILAQRGEGEEPVALLLEQGAPATATILGVLKAGKMYVPLDPAYPYARTAFILEDSQARLIVTSEKHRSLANTLAQGGRQVFNIDEIDASLSSENLDLPLSPDTLAYILYTSGSTGQPKGVFENHRNVLHHIMRITNELHMSVEDRQTLLRSYSFNGAVRDMFGALLNGAALYSLNLEEEGIGRLARWLIEEEITVYRSVISVFRHFVGTLTGKEAFPKLRLIHVGGEPVYRKDVELYRRYFPPGCIFLNGLGITEAGSARHYLIDHTTPIPESRVPVGYELDGIQVLVLDDAGEGVGFDRIGEIAVRSRYLSLGYWRKPELTQAKFLPDPKGGDERIYLTGDLGLMHPDGCLVHLGRKDFQVKVRGHRIEVAEIETALLALEAIKAAVVLVGEERSDDLRLVAYCVPAVQHPPTVSSLRLALAQTLPDYMIPAAFVIMEAMPLTATGKVDRQALPAPGRIRPTLDNPYVPPRTPIEETLADLWAKTLMLEQVGVYDNFLDSGGHSLLATQIISKVIQTFQVDLPVKSLFESPTVAEMALIITQHQAMQADPEAIERILARLERSSDVGCGDHRLAEGGTVDR